MQETTPIFKDVNQALHVCFLIHSLPPGTVSPTATVIDRMREHYDFDEEPSESKGKSTVNFTGLSPYEIRGQAAQVVSMVNNLPSKIEGSALKLWYGRDALQVQGVAEFSDGAQAMIAENKDFARALVMYVMPDKRDDVCTAQDIASEYGMTVRNVRYYIDKTRKLLNNYRNRGIESLEGRFKSGELVGDFVE